VDHVGFKYHGNSIMAAIALVQLRYLDSDNAYRRELAAVYDEFLASVPEVGRIPMAAGCTPSRHLYQVLVDNREDVILALNASDVFPGVHYQENASYRAYAGSRAECPRAVAFSARLLSLPLHLRMTHKDAEAVSELLRNATRENRVRRRI
jgi:dTDP-4-amino-4,6-dideoxygalactose transaminase